MATSTATNTGVQQALLFMPDISGFTEFVNTNEIIHAQSIIQEVLEIIVESNKINLQVGEIEGDAVFFYRMGDRPGMEELLDQVQTMFTRFHQHLNLFDKQRICPCTACGSAANLQLKIIAHFGEVAGYSVKSHNKLFGKDVIVLHRLLKNNLNKKEYALLTNALLDDGKEKIRLPDWFQPVDASETYDVGEISFKVSDLSSLRSQLPPLEIPEYNSFSKARTVFTEEGIINAPAQSVFGTIFDITQRPKWSAGIRDIEMVSKDLINRVGTMHRCIISSKNNPVIVTEYAHIGSTGAELVEMDRKGMGGCRYKVEAIGENQTRLKMDVLVRNNPLLLAFFNLFLKNRLRKKISRSIINLREYLTQPVTKTITATPAHTHH